MKGTIISFVMGAMVLWSLNHRVLEPFFKIKRKRLQKNSNFEETSSKISKVSTAKGFRKKQQRQVSLKPPIKK